MIKMNELVIHAKTGEPQNNCAMKKARKKVYILHLYKILENAN